MLDVPETAHTDIEKTSRYTRRALKYITYSRAVHDMWYVLTLLYSTALHCTREKRREDTTIDTLLLILIIDYQCPQQNRADTEMSLEGEKFSTLTKVSIITIIHIMVITDERE